MLTGLQHVNLTVGSADWETQHPLELADVLYGEILGLKQDPVPPGMEGKLRWFALGNSGQQIHVSLEPATSKETLVVRSLTRQHPCFTLPYQDLNTLMAKLDTFAESGHPAAPSKVVADRSPMETSPDGSQAHGSKKGDRFFIRDFAGNRLEFVGV